MEQEKIGIENLKKVMSFVISLFEQTTDALSDGKITFWEGLGFIPELKEIGNFIPKFGIIKEEVEDLSAAEAQELAIFIGAKFNRSQNDAKQKIESALNWISATYGMYKTFKK